MANDLIKKHIIMIEILTVDDQLLASIKSKKKAVLT